MCLSYTASEIYSDFSELFVKKANFFYSAYLGRRAITIIMPPHQIGGVKESCAVYPFLCLSVLCVVSKSVRFRAITLIGNLMLKSEVEPIGQCSRVTTSR